MQPATRLAPQAWMTAAATRRVVAALTADGTAVRFVGGCVRDAVAGRSVKDIDIATPDPPQRVMELLRRANIHAIPTGFAHGTVTAVSDGKPFEITTLRHDVETYGRHAKVAFTDDWVADAARRDFTINALSCAPDGAVFDPFNGLADLQAGLVRFVGDPYERIREDVLRLLRFFRFYAHFGRPPPHAESLAACTALAPKLPTLSAERVRAELLRLLEAPDPAPVLHLMQEAGVLPFLLPEATRFDRLTAMPELEVRHTVPDPVRRLAATLEVDAAGALAVAQRLKLSNAERDRLVALASRPDLGSDPAAMRRALYRLGAERYGDLAFLSAAETGDTALLEQRLLAARAWQPHRLPLTGGDVMRLGVPRGPEIGRLLAAVEEWWLAGDFQASREACLEQLRKLTEAATEPTPAGPGDP